MKSLITPDEAMRLIREALPTFPAIQCPLDKCAGRILRETISADRPFPPFNRSMMDGYAVRAKDIHGEAVFQITVQAPAGSPIQSIGSEPQSCAEIMTGAVVPDDADCVVPYEKTAPIDDQHMKLLNPAAHATGDCIHPSASDRSAGETVIESGRLLGSREIAVAATCGFAELSVSKIPAIAIVSTGDELVDIAQKPAPHQIRRSNDIMIDTALALVQLHSQVRAHLPDDEDHCRSELAQLIRQNQVMLLSGGVSMGKKDYIPEVLESLDMKNHFHGILQKPGKPMGFWSNDACAVFTLPGNPLSTLTCMHHYVLPALIEAMGSSKTIEARTVSITGPIRARDDLTIFLPVKIESKNRALPQPTQNSGDLVRILRSDGYIIVPPCAEKGYPASKTFHFHPWH
ncbi:MAG: molybdopterin molybdotransferase MoeA [Lentimonas sp.]